MVSCQPEAKESFYDTAFVSGMAQAAILGGAGALRLNHPDTLRALKQVNGLKNIPMIGIWKKEYAGSDVYITPTRTDARAIYEAGAEILAIDATDRQRPAETLSEIVNDLKGKVCLMADISTLEEGINAARLGFDCIGTTLSGYTEQSRTPKKTGTAHSGPDFDLLKALVERVEVPVIAEGRISTPGEAAEALRLGAHAVVVGSAITRPQVITRSFLARMHPRRSIVQ